ncbi:MAG: AMP-binding protein [Bacteroidales bacterium]
MNKGLNSYIEDSIKAHWELPALSDFKGVAYQYKDIARKIVKIHIMLEAAGVKQGDKIAICGRNSSHWAVALFATLSYGAVAVPILHEFKSDNVHNIVNHCEAKLLFVGDVVWENLSEEMMPGLLGIIMIDDFSVIATKIKALEEARHHLNELFGKRFPERFTPESIHFYEDSPEELAIINYTSGSTGFSKGVMLPYRSLCANLKFYLANLDCLQAGHNTVSMLPMAHMYGLMIELFNPFTKGAHIHFLTRIPSPKIIMDAFAECKPPVIIAVPLIMEKIIKTKIFPLLDKPMMKLLMMIPIVDTQLLGKIKAKIEESFGGNLKQVIVGGAPLNKEVEEFLHKIKFPITIGYGMTECGPLVSYCPWEEFKQGSCGKIVEYMNARIDSSYPEQTAGELWLKGDNIMLGYYKNEEATASVLKDGWMNTGDLALIDDENFLYIKGRSKNMILGPSGQNIYPEEIEDQLNNLSFVNESIVIGQEGKLVWLVYPDFENGEKMGITQKMMTEQMEENRININKNLPVYSQISKVKIYYEEFEKTPKRSIKRYLYQTNNV